MIKLIKGDCLIEHDKIEDGSVELILTDLPYGYMNTDAIACKNTNRNFIGIEKDDKYFDIAKQRLTCT